MPVQNGKPSNVAERARVARARKLDWCPADFPSGSGRNRGAQHLGHQLRAQTDAERRALKLDTGGNRRHFWNEEGISLHFVGPDGTSQNDQEIGVRSGMSVQFADANLEIAQVAAALTQDLFHNSSVFKSNVTQCQAIFHRSGPASCDCVMSSNKPWNLARVQCRNS